MTDTHKIIAIAVLIGLTTMTVYRPVLSSRAMIFDDAEYITLNPLVLNPGMESIRRFFIEILNPSKEGYYQPVAMTSLMLDAAMGAGPHSPEGFRATSLVLHAGNTILLTVLLYMLFGHVWAAAFAGLLFGLHPITVEPVAWISERTTLLATFFGLTALIAHAAYAGTHDRRWRWAAFGFFALGLMSKPTILLLPVMMMIMNIWPLDRWKTAGAGIGKRFAAALAEKTPLILLAFLFGVVVVITMGRSGNVHLPSEAPVMNALLHASRNIVFYLRHIVWPAGLSPHYPYPEIVHFGEPLFLAGLLGTGAATLAAVLALRRTPAVLAGWLMFIVALLPTMPGVRFSNAMAADKYLYFPVPGLLMILTAGTRHFLAAGNPAGKKRRLVLLACIAAVLAVIQGMVLRSSLAHWHDDIAINKRMVARAPNAITHTGLGVALARQGSLAGSRESFYTRRGARARLCERASEPGDGVYSSGSGRCGDSSF